MERNITVILFVENQIQQMQMALKTIQMFTSIPQNDIIIVDCASKDGLSEWLRQQPNQSCLLCNEEEESYIEILKTAICQFAIKTDILLLTPEYLLLPETLKRMINVLHSKENIGAVSGRIIQNDSIHGMDFSAAVDYMSKQNNTGEVARKMYLTEGVTLVNAELLQSCPLDEKITSLCGGMIDLFFFGMLSGWEFYECQDACFFQIMGSTSMYVTASDIEILKRKWHMNYFSVAANPSLLHFVEKETREIHVLEIGCDCGANLLEIKNLCPNAKLYGVEINPESAKFASLFAEVSIGDIEKQRIDFNQKKFDYVLFGDVLEHLRNPEETLRYCRELLCEDGKILACIPNLMHYTVMKELINGNFTYTDTGLLDKTHIHFFTYKEILRMFHKVQLCVEDIFMKESVRESIPAEDKVFIENLCKMSDGAEEFMYYTYQYIVLAKK